MHKIPFVKNHWAKTYKALEFNTIPWVPLPKPLAECKVSLITTGGVHLKTDTPFDMSDSQGDPSYRTIPSTTEQKDLTITHQYYDCNDAKKDINIVLPIQAIHQAQQSGRILETSKNFYSLMGHIEGEEHISTLIDQTAGKLSRMLKKEKVDVAVLSPA